MKLLFVCTHNISRSRTGEDLFKLKHETKSAGTHEYATTPITQQAIDWADKIIVMENKHVVHIMNKFKVKKTIINLDIPDIYVYMEDELVEIMKNKFNNLNLT